MKLCASVNVSIPNYLGCSPSLASKFSASAATTGQQSPASQSNAASSYSGQIQSAVMLPTSGPVATFTGRALFTGTCTSPEYAMVTMDGGGVLEYPWAGCSNDRPGCCPFDIKVGGLLNVCPSDYTTTSGACCPSYVPLIAPLGSISDEGLVVGQSIPPLLVIKYLVYPF